MLALARTAPKHVSRLVNGQLTVRTLADVVVTPPNKSAIGVSPPALRGTPTSTQASSRSVHVLSKERIPVTEDHGLYAFFRRREGTDTDLVGDAKYEVVEAPEKVQRVTGRSWKASELRLKSFRDLHTLWYVLLRERNLLATQKEEARRMGVTDTETQVSLEKVHQCRKSMARIKAVMNERRLAYEGAVKLAEQQKEEHYDEMVLQHQDTQFRAERKYLQRRRQYMARKETKRLEREMEGAQALTQGSVPEGEVDGSPAAKEDPPEPLPAEAKQPGADSVEATESESPHPTRTKPVDAATVGLFGDVRTPQSGQKALDHQ